MSVFALVAVIVGGVVLVNAVIWGIVLGIMSRRRTARYAEVEEHLATTGARPVLGPARGNYCGGTGDYPRVANNSLLTVTPAELLIHPYFGSSITIRMPEVTETRVARSWNGRVVGGRQFLVIATGHGEVGLLVPDTGGWLAELQRLTEA